MGITLKGSKPECVKKMASVMLMSPEALRNEQALSSAIIPKSMLCVGFQKLTNGLQTPRRPKNRKRMQGGHKSRYKIRYSASYRQIKKQLKKVHIQQHINNIICTQYIHNIIVEAAAKKAKRAAGQANSTYVNTTTEKEKQVSRLEIGMCLDWLIVCNCRNRSKEHASCYKKGERTN